jgi:hypothetical protein
MHTTALTFFFQDEVSQPICPGWPGITILPILASCIAGITGRVHSAQLLVEMGH